MRKLTEKGLPKVRGTKFSAEGLCRIASGKKNTPDTQHAYALRTTWLSLNGGEFRPFSTFLCKEFHEATTIRAYGKIFSLYQKERLNKSLPKVVWI